MTTSPRLRLFLGTLRPATALGVLVLVLGACNAILGIEDGLPLGGATTDGAGGSTSSGATCSPAPGATKGAARKILVSTSSPGYEQGNAVAHDAGDNLVVAGFFAGGSIDLGKPLEHLGEVGKQAGFVVELDPQGAYRWDHAFGGTEDLRVNAAGADAAGNVYVTGTFSGAATSDAIDLTAAYDAMQSMSGQPDAFVIALDEKGTTRWSKRFGNALTQRGLRIAVDAAGDSYVAGTSVGRVDFGDGDGLIGDAGAWSFFFKLAPSGAVLWAQSVGSFPAALPPDPDETFDIALTLDGKGHLIIGGAFEKQAYFGAEQETAVGDVDAFVASLDAADGKMLWHRTFHQPKGDTDPDGNQWITALAVEPCSGDIYAAGGFTEGIDFESRGGDKVSHGDTHDQDMFLVKLAASDGAPIWKNTYGDSGFQVPTAVKVAADGTVLFSGFLINGADPQGLDCGTEIGYLPALQGDLSGTSDLFLLKLDSQGKGLWGKRRGDSNPQTAFDVSVSSKGEIALVGITNGTLALGDNAAAQMSSSFDVFVARFDP